MTNLRNTYPDNDGCVWCCGCDVHPTGKPWGWNHSRWNRHFERAHDGEHVPGDDRPVAGYRADGSPIHVPPGLAEEYPQDRGGR